CHWGFCALCSNSLYSFPPRVHRRQHIARVPYLQEPSYSWASHNCPASSRDTAVVVERDKNGNPSGAKKINPGEVEDQAGCPFSETGEVVGEAADIGGVDLASDLHDGRLVSAMSAH